MNNPGKKRKMFGRKPKLKMYVTNVTTGQRSVSFLHAGKPEEPMVESTDDNPLAAPPPPPPPPPDNTLPDSDRTQTRRTYASIKQREATGWRDIHDKLLATGTELAVPTSFLCMICKQEQPATIYRCQDCGPTTTFCFQCLELKHENSLHLPEIWTNTSTCFQPFMDANTCLRRRDDHCCSTGSSPRAVKVYDDSGRPHVMDIYFCRCEPEACTLLRLGLWAASPQSPDTAFSVSLLKSLVSLSLACHVSVEGFCQSLRWRNNLSLHEYNSLYRALVGAAIAEFRHYHYKKSTLQHLCPQLDDGTLCPACSKEDGEKIIMLDANFGLVRKASSGTSYAAPHHGNRMFAEDQKVQSFLESHSDARKPDEDCSDFQAGSRIRSKNTQKKLDVTGVFGAACRHEMPLQFLNMKHGERLGYPVFLIRQLLQQAQNDKLRLHVIYDIACNLKSHLSNPKNRQEHLLQQMQFSIPAFHIYGHKTPCQILYSTRRQEGLGLTDGEGMERIWSYLRPFFRITKEMTPTHRQDLLTDALLHYAKRKSTDIEMSICLRMEKAEKTFTLADEDLKQIIAQAPVPVSEEDILKWEREEKETIRVQKSTPTYTAGIPRWQKEYVMKLTEFHALRQEIADTEDGSDLAASHSILRGIRENLSTIERKHGVSRRWKSSDGGFQRILKKVDEEERTKILSKARTQAWELSHLLRMKAKFPEGQKTGNKVSGQLKTMSGKLEKSCADYNAIRWDPLQTKFPRTINPKEARQPHWEVYTSLDLTFMGQEGIPHSIQRDAIDTLSKKVRSKEEQQMLQEEMKMVMKYLLQEHSKAEQALQGSCKLGEQSVLIGHLVNLEKRMKFAGYLFAKYHPELPDLPVDYLTRIYTPPSFQPSEVQLELDEALSEEEPMSEDDNY